MHQVQILICKHVQIVFKITNNAKEFAIFIRNLVLVHSMGNIHFSVSHEVYDGEQVNELHTFEIKEWVVMPVPF